MVDERLRDGRRIAQLIASEIHADATLEVVDADPEVEPTADGAFAYAVTRSADADTDDAAGNANEGAGDDAGAERVAEVYVQPDRVRAELLAAPESAAEAAAVADLRVRPKAVRPPRTLAFVEDGAQAKRALGVIRAATEGDEADEESDSDSGTDAGADAA